MFYSFILIARRLRKIYELLGDKPSLIDDTRFSSQNLGLCYKQSIKVHNFREKLQILREFTLFGECEIRYRTCEIHNGYSYNGYLF